jgi:hypothetical protein
VGGAEREISVTSDAVRIVGPRGFCVDPTATRNSGDSAFVLMGNCAAIAGTRRAGQPEIRAVLTAAVSAPGDGGEISENLEELEGFFRSAEGRRLLSRSQQPSSVTILDTAVAGDVFYLHARDTSDGPLDGVEDSYWRAYLDIGRRIATLTVLGRSDAGPTDAEALSALQRFAGAVQAANPTPGAVVPDAAVEATDAGPGWNFGVFRRILR